MSTSALRRLTFMAEPQHVRAWEEQNWQQPDWDDWYEQRRGQSREAWAAAAVHAAEPANDPRSGALDDLRLTRNPQWLPEFRSAAGSAWYATRIAGAHGVAIHARDEGIELLRRELTNRSPDAFDRAVDALNVITGRHLGFEATDPADRLRAIHAYTPAQ